MAEFQRGQVTYSPLQPKGQSNSNIPIPKVNRLGVGLGDLVRYPRLLNILMQLSSVPNVLTYPSDRPKYFMHFGIYYYSTR